MYTNKPQGQKSIIALEQEINRLKRRKKNHMLSDSSSISILIQKLEHDLKIRKQRLVDRKKTDTDPFSRYKQLASHGRNHILHNQLTNSDPIQARDQYSIQYQDPAQGQHQTNAHENSNELSGIPKQELELHTVGLMAQTQALQTKYQSLRNKYKSLKNEHQALQEHTQQERIFAQQQEIKTKQEIATLVKQGEEIEFLIAEQKIEHESIREQLQSQNQSLTHRLEQYQSENRQLKETVASYEAKSHERIEVAEKYDGRNRELEQQLKQLQSQNQELTQQIALYRGQNHDLRQQQVAQNRLSPSNLAQLSQTGARSTETHNQNSFHPLSFKQMATNRQTSSQNDSSSTSSLNGFSHFQNNSRNGSSKKNGDPSSGHSSFFPTAMQPRTNGNHLGRMETSTGRTDVDGLKWVPVDDDGNCFYQSVAKYLDNTDTQHLRKIVHKTLKDNIDDYRGFFDGASEDEIEGRIASYMQDILNPNGWAGDLEIMILSQAFNRPIIVIGPDSQIVNQQSLEVSRGEPIFVYYNKINHYDELVVQPGYTGQGILHRLLQRNQSAMRQSHMNGMANENDDNLSTSSRSTTSSQRSM